MWAQPLIKSNFPSLSLFCCCQLRMSVNNKNVNTFTPDRSFGRLIKFHSENGKFPQKSGKVLAMLPKDLWPRYICYSFTIWKLEFILEGFYVAP
jgi:hypothetical protein